MALTNSKYFNLVRFLHNERCSFDELIDRHSAQLRKLVSNAYNTVVFYKRLFDNYCLQPNDIHSIENISKILIIDKKMMTCTLMMI